MTLHISLAPLSYFSLCLIASTEESTQEAQYLHKDKSRISGAFPSRRMLRCSGRLFLPTGLTIDVFLSLLRDRDSPTGDPAPSITGSVTATAEASSFVQRLLQSDPSLHFDEIVAAWDDATSEAGPKSLSGVSLPEIQLLNGKLLDCFDRPRLKPALRNALAVNPPAQDGFLGDGLFTMRNSPSMGMILADAGGHPPGGDIRFYSPLHYAAELGSTDLLDFLRGLEGGIPVEVRLDQCCSVPDRHGPQRLPAFDWVACCAADAGGYTVAHRAAASGHVNVLTYLVEAYGADNILNASRLRPIPGAAGSGGFRGGEKHTVGRNVAFVALWAGQLSVVDWLRAHHPEYVQFTPHFVCCVLIAAALANCVGTFEYFMRHRLFPISFAVCPTVGHGSCRSSGAHASELVSDASAPDNTLTLFDCLLLEGTKSVLTACACFAAVHAAAEAGSDRVIFWFIAHFGEEVLWVGDTHGATCLHHCARGGHTQLLATLLAQFPAAAERVDVVDNRGRPPAVWCVLGGGRGKHVVATLQLLQQHGSQWTLHRDAGHQSLLDVARQRYSKFSRVVKYIGQQMTEASARAARDFGVTKR